jgi:GH24 family phage-related lysozyme (muramidase)
MYRCTGGEVTIGIGHAIQTADDAVKLAWQVDGRAATPGEIQADYARVAASDQGLLASRYAALSQVRMPNDAIDALASSDVDSFWSQIAAKVPGFAGYPDCVQSALFDMAFNLGVGGLLGFHNLLAACAAGDWTTAANECHRRGISDDRNQQTADLFRQAALVTN